MKIYSKITLYSYSSLSKILKKTIFIKSYKLLNIELIFASIKRYILHLFLTTPINKI